jgi:hypothetical protein
VRKARGKVESLPGDGWVRLVPGAFFELHADRPLKPNMQELLLWMRNIRAGVLSASFGIENELILMALAGEFGSNDHGSVSSSYFKREQEIREDHNLERKIARVKPIIRRLREKKDADKLIQNLSSYRDLRNLLAHYPCWLEPVNDVEQQRTVALKLFIGDRTHIWEIDEAQATEWDSLITNVRIAIENVRRELIGAEPLGPDGTPPMAKAAP